jgi:hypothetical protein
MRLSSKQSFTRIPYYTQLTVSSGHQCLKVVIILTHIKILSSGRGAVKILDFVGILAGYPIDNELVSICFRNHVRCCK